MLKQVQNKKYKKFSDKVVWLVGCSTGIGREIAKELLLHGAYLVLSSRNKEKMLELNQYGGNVLLVPFDVAQVSLDDLNEIESKIISCYKKIDYLFLNAGITHDYPCFERTDCDVDRVVFETNFFGLIKIAKQVSNLFLSQGFGHMVVSSSVMGKFGYPNKSMYCASKHALHGFFESLRLEVLSCQCDFYVTMVVLGAIDTDIGFNALNSSGEKLNRKGQFQKGGLSSEVCAKRILFAVAQCKWEVFIGNSEIYFVYIKRLFSKLFYGFLYRHCLKSESRERRGGS